MCFSNRKEQYIRVKSWFNGLIQEHCSFIDHTVCQEDRSKPVSCI